MPNIRTYTLNDASEGLLKSLENRDRADRHYRKSKDPQDGRDWRIISRQCNRQAAGYSKDIDEILDLAQAAEDRGDFKLASELRGEAEELEAADPEEDPEES